VIDAKQIGRDILRRNETYLVVLILAFSAMVASASPAFLTPGNLLSVLRGGAGIGILAVAFYVALIGGGIEISFPAIAISSQYIAIRTMLALNIDSLWFAFAIAVAVGILAGLINAFFITTLKIPAMIVTLGTANLYHGALLEFLGTGAVNVGRMPSSISAFGSRTVFQFQTANGTQGLSIFVAILVVVALGTWLMMRYTMLGRGIFAIGGDMEGAKRAGFNVRRIQYFIYCYVGFLAGIMGIIHVSLIRYAHPANIMGDNTLLRVIAAVILGGTSITGGRGTLSGTMLGVLLVVLVDRHLIMLGIPQEWTEFFVGVVIVGGVLATHIRLKLEKKRKGELIVERAH
jgi:simple sugar transport system permease protein